MSQTHGTQTVDDFLNGMSSGAQSDYLAEHGISSALSPYIGTTKNPTVAEYFARGANQDQAGYVTTFRIESREARALQDQGAIVPNFENPMSFFEPNPAIGLPESEFLFGNQIDAKYIYQQVPVGGKTVSFDTSNLQSKLEGYLLNVTHPQNQNKATWFQLALGFDKSNWQELASQIQFNESSATLQKATQYGQIFEQIIPIKGANGRVIDTPFYFKKEVDGTVTLVTSKPSRK